MMLMKGGKPSEDWKSYPVKVIEQFDSYEQAAMKEVEIFRSESENEETLRRGKRLKLSKTTKTQYDASGSDSCEEVTLSVYKKPALTNEKNKTSEVYTSSNILSSLTAESTSHFVNNCDQGRKRPNYHWLTKLTLGADGNTHQQFNGENEIISREFKFLTDQNKLEKWKDLNKRREKYLIQLEDKENSTTIAERILRNLINQYLLTFYIIIT